ncbi:MAG TPA: methyltransferase domain-containing protein [Steroidobacteraceae bacterium]|nr:methyltransferase domain-containing protein [Steroidobacteraceae bacterium]
MTAAAKAYKGMGMEGSLARWYERTTRKDLPEFQALAARIAAHVPARGAVLEVAPGPGFLSIELARRGFDVRAVDISKTFAELTRRNAAAAGVTVQFEVGNASALPVPDAIVDFVVCRAAFKNFTAPIEALREMRRALRPGGTALLIDMRRDASVAEIRRYVAGLGVNWLNRMFMMATFRGMLIKRAYPLEEIRRMMALAGWIEPQLALSPIGFEAWMRK